MTQWENSCLACIRSWVPSSAPQKQQKQKLIYLTVNLKNMAPSRIGALSCALTTHLLKLFAYYHNYTVGKRGFFITLYKKKSSNSVIYIKE
jgi:hypothetical protein